MLIVGASGHAKEILDVLSKNDLKFELNFFDNVTPDLPHKLYDTFRIIRTDDEVREVFKYDPSYILGVGGSEIRYKLCLKMNSLGGRLTSVISSLAIMGDFNIELGEGVNIMHNALISNDVHIGKGTLVNARSSIHHDVKVGQFCEISPGAILTGGVQIGDFTSIGSGVVVLPKIKIGKNVVVGAGAIVTKNLADNIVAIGAPAKAKVSKYLD
ncbi:acetyltransferase [Rufibacter immobilis]|uniref:acetyltransferase n=1 Tax=Rufibacter immobilis TaxID=1348778 RepID=UPI0035EC7CF1